jgi:hypothetical protein
MPNMRLTEIGARSNGVVASEAIAQVMGHVMQVAARTSAQSGFFQGMDEESLKELQSSLGLPSSLMDQFKGDAKALGDAVKGMFDR